MLLLAVGIGAAVFVVATGLLVLANEVLLHNHVFAAAVTGFALGGSSMGFLAWWLPRRASRAR